ncbi:hypothetical protein [Jiangella rhizosphaerae]|nr:hypothetical protein [Jiangella rhizosphaerae]
MHWRRARLVVAATAVLAVAPGCASDPGAPPAPPGEADAAHLALPIEPYLVGPDDAAVLDRATVTLVERCLRRFGEDADLPVPDPGPRLGPTERRYGLTDPAVAATHGYHLAGDATRSGPAPVAVDDTVLLGATTPGATVAGLAVPEGGCVGEASRAVGGAPGSAEIVQRINADSVSGAMTDPRVVAAFAAWSACMADAGYDYDDPWQPPADGWLEDATPSTEEIAVATADVACKESTRLVAIWHHVDVELQEELVAAHEAELALVERDNRRRLEAAREVLADGQAG